MYLRNIYLAMFLEMEPRCPHKSPTTIIFGENSKKILMCPKTNSGFCLSSKLSLKVTVASTPNIIFLLADPTGGP